MNPGNPANTVDTIVAISTPPGRGGIGIVRLSGPSAILLAEGLLQLRHSLRDPGSHARAWFAKVLDPATAQNIKKAPQEALKTPQNKLDDALVSAFHAPHSYTGEDLVEIAAHGSPVILDAILRAALDLGERLELPVRLATAGEFTQRAFLNGRLDLTQAEAVHDLIAAQTIDQARVAAQQLGGALSRRVAPAKEQLLHLIAILEAGMDFASGELDDIEVVPREDIASAIQSVEAPLAELAASFHRGQLLRNGAAIALVGRPNAGKSSLFNRLLERERAIVTPVPGTTRDTLEEVLSLGGIPIRLIDTAGLRAATTDEVEALGMKRTEEALADADLILYIDDISIRNIDDTSNPGMQADPELPLKPNRDRPHMIVHNKCDLLPETYKNILIGTDSEVYTSALTGQGLEELRTMILGKLRSSGSLAESGLLNNHRQQQAILETLKALSAATAANSQGLPHELLLVDLHTALRALDSLTGATTSDDILARIFSTFCIGK